MADGGAAGALCRGAGRRRRARVPNWVYTDPDIFAREQELIFSGPSWLYHLPRSRDSQSRRFQAQPARRPRGRRGQKQGRRGQRRGQPLRPSQHAVLHDQPRHRKGVRLPLSPMDLRPRRQVARPAVPPRLQGQGRHAGRFRPGRARARNAGGRLPQRRRLRQLRPAERDARNLSRAEDARLFRPRLRRPRSSRCSATCASASRATGS